MIDQPTRLNDEFLKNKRIIAEANILEKKLHEMNIEKNSVKIKEIASKSSQKLLDVTPL